MLKKLLLLVLLVITIPVSAQTITKLDFWSATSTNGIVPRNTKDVYLNILGSTQCLRVNSDGKIVGTGSDCGSGSGGASYLYQLSDVNLTSTSTGDILYWNGTKWVNLGISTDNKVLKLSGGVPTWQDDATGSAGGGITSLNGLTTDPQSFATSSPDANVRLNITSSGSTHTFTPYFFGTLADNRIASASRWNDFITAYFATTTHPNISSLPALSITESQISDLGTYLTTETDPIYSVSSTSIMRAGTTSDTLTEGSTNLFWTPARLIAGLLNGYNAIFTNSTTTNATTTNQYISGTLNVNGTTNLGVVTGVSLDEVENLTADKTFTMTDKNLTFNFTTPSEGLTINATGAFNDHVLHIHQMTGNPSAGTQLAHLHAEDPDVIGLVIDQASASTSPALQILSGTSDLRGGLVTMGNASTTVLSATSLCLSADCRTTWPTGTGGGGVGTSTEPFMAKYFVATGTIASFLPYASTTALTVSGNSYLMGNVGIGLSPATTFEILGLNNTGSVGGVTSQRIFSANSSASLNLNFNSVWTTGTGQDLRFGTGGVENMRISTAGYVGIASTTPVDFLSIDTNNNTANIVTGINMRNTNASFNRATGINFHVAGVVPPVASVAGARGLSGYTGLNAGQSTLWLKGDHQLFTNNTGTEYARLNSNGLGLGTTTPYAGGLTIHGTAPALYFNDSSAVPSATNPVWRASADNTTGTFLIASSPNNTPDPSFATQLQISTATTTTTGDLAIGTGGTDDSKLDFAGSFALGHDYSTGLLTLASGATLGVGTLLTATSSQMVAYQPLSITPVAIATDVDAPAMYLSSQGGYGSGSASSNGGVLNVYSGAGGSSVGEAGNSGNLNIYTANGGNNVGASGNGGDTGTLNIYTGNGGAPGIGGTGGLSKPINIYTGANYTGTATTSVFLQATNKGKVAIGTTTENSILNLGSGNSTNGTTTITMEKIQFDGYNSAGQRRCVFLNSVDNWSVQTGACTP